MQVLAVAAMGSATVSMTAGDLVLVQGLLLQLWGPLQVSLPVVCSSEPPDIMYHVMYCMTTSQSFKTDVLELATSFSVQILGWFYRELWQSLVYLYSPSSHSLLSKT